MEAIQCSKQNKVYTEIYRKCRNTVGYIYCTYADFRISYPVYAAVSKV